MAQLVKLSDIKIKDSFAAHTPKQEKMNECRENWNLYKKQDRHIVVDHNGYLIDGYVQYLVLQEYGIEEAEVKFSDKKRGRWRRKDENFLLPKYRNEETVYVYGRHWNRQTQQYSKEYVWRIPKSWQVSGLYRELEIGEKILVKTQYGTKVVEVTRIEILNECPVETPVRRVARIFTEQNVDKLSMMDCVNKMKSALDRLEVNCEEKQGTQYSMYEDIASINDALKSVVKLLKNK